MPLSLQLALLVLITFLTRIVALLQTQTISNDGVFYIQIAKIFSEGKYEEISNTYFNFYPLLLFFIQKLIGDWELSGKLISLTLGTLTVVPVFLLGRSLYNEKVGWFSALFYIILPNFLKYNSDVLRDPTGWFFMTLTLWLVWDGIQKNRLVFLGLASISGGLGALTRVEGFVLWGALAIFTALRRVPDISLKRRGLNVAFLVLLFPLLFSLVFFSMKKHSSRIAFGKMTSFSVNFIIDHSRKTLQPTDPIIPIGQKTYNSLPNISKYSLELARGHRVVVAISEVIYKFIKSANLLIVLILLGLWKRKKEGFESSDWYLLYMFAALFGMSVFYTWQIYYFSTRHGLTLVLPSLYFAAPGLLFLTETFSRGINRFTPGWAIMKGYMFHILTFSLIMIFLFQGFSVKREDKTNLKEVGLWLKENGYQGSVIMGSKEFIRLVFYADGKFLEIPNSWEMVIGSIHQNRVRLVVVDSCTIEQDYPGFLANLPQAGLFPIQGPKGEKGKYEIQIYGVY
jgi:4-amino-4-deoxy-L-arabinose transferase-like glycosyltransferase